MNNITLRQVRAVIAVCEEGSFTRAAEREAATQSGISQHIAALEQGLGVKLFERSNSGVVPTAAGRRFYRRCIEAIGTLKTGAEEMRAVAGRVAGNLRIGLMPTFTRAALAPALKAFVAENPDVTLKIVEGYSAMLTDHVLAEELDLAVVPAFEGRIGLRSRLLARDREVLISGRARGLTPLQPVRLRDLAPLRLVVPGPANVRRRTIDVYCQVNGVEIAEMIEMDAMIGTLEFIAATDWVTVLPSIICVNDIESATLRVNPIADPPLYSEFVVVEPARQALSVQATLFLEKLETEVARIHDVFAQAGLAHP